jgi:hypothetical protein
LQYFSACCVLLMVRTTPSVLPYGGGVLHARVCPTGAESLLYVGGYEERNTGGKALAILKQIAPSLAEVFASA